MPIKTWLSVIATTAVLASAHAQEARTLYLQAGGGDNSANAITLGATLPWNNWSWSLCSGMVRGHWDMYVSNWSSRADGEGRRNTAVIGIGPSLRWRGDGGASPWFAEVGTGASLSNRLYRNADNEFSTRFNFASHLGVGRNFGARNEHELSLRLQHSSNAGIKSPNPGENFLLLRYAHAF